MGMFAWTLNYFCSYFEDKLLNDSIDIVQELTNLIAEIILILNTADIQNNIVTKEEEMKLFAFAMNKYLIRCRLKRIWSKVMGGNMISFTNGFPVSVAALFNHLMDLC